MKPLVIGFTGLFATGKDTAAQYLSEKHGFVHESLGDIIRAEARRRAVELNRPNLLALGNELRAQQGPEVLAKLALVAAGAAEKIVITGLRNSAEVEYLRNAGGFVLVELTANPEIRLARMQSRAREGEEAMSMEKLLAREKADQGTDPTGAQLHKVITMADQVISDNGSKEELYQKIDHFLKILQTTASNVG